MFRYRVGTALVAGLLLVGGCSGGNAIVPAEIFEMVNEQGRERTYDLAWQDIRQLEGAVEREEKSSSINQALFTLSRINRLAEGKASGMNADRFLEILDTASQYTSSLSRVEQHQLLRKTVLLLRMAFDAGDFIEAQNHALKALAYARVWSASSGDG